MLSVQQADAKIEAIDFKCDQEIIPIQETYCRVLDEDVLTDRSSPAFNKSLMDGIAVNFDTVINSSKILSIAAVQAAGEPSVQFDAKTQCVQIMTGAIVPDQADTVIPIEDVTVKDGFAKIHDDIKIQKNSFIRFEGSDYKAGKSLCEQGQKISSVVLANLVSVGRASLRVKKKIKTAVISTGNEIVDLNTQHIEPYQIRDANAFGLQAALQGTGIFEADKFHFCDKEKELIEGVTHLLDNYQLLVFSGGVSMGKFDLVPKILEQCQVKSIFHKIKQKPGKPLWFGQGKRGQWVFGLPGNPVSSMTCLHRYVIKHIQKKLGCREKSIFIPFDEKINLRNEFTSFIPVQLRTQGAKCIPYEGSSHLSALIASDGFVEINAGFDQNKKNKLVNYYAWK